MVRRFIPLVMALTIAFAPVALETCQASCALHDSVHAAEAHHHAMGHPATASHQEPTHRCHEMTMPVPDGSGARASMTGVPHSCAHTDELPPSAAAFMLVVFGPPATPSLFAPVAIASVRPTVGVDTLELSGRTALTTQLRV